MAEIKHTSQIEKIKFSDDKKEVVVINDDYLTYYPVTDERIQEYIRNGGIIEEEE